MSSGRPLRSLLFRLHWLLGISAGLVLAVVGASGALLSYEDAWLRLANPAPAVTPASAPLPLDALLRELARQRPQARVQGLSLERGASALRVQFAPAEGQGRGETVPVDRYTGALLPAPRGEALFRTVMQLHRWLLAGEAGKQVVGAATVALLFFCLSGLYLRWPGTRWRSLRTWFAIDPGRRGRPFWWQLHAVLGTWLLPVYLVVAASGLTWSYPAWRTLLQHWAGVEAPVRGAAAPAMPAPFDPGPALARFEADVPDWRMLSLRWPEAGGGATLRYLDRDAPHERAFGTVAFDVDGRQVLEHVRWHDRPWRARLVGSLFALHRGSAFGVAGPAVFMLASALLPLFAFSGWWLYLDRRRRRAGVGVRGS